MGGCLRKGGDETYESKVQPFGTTDLDDISDPIKAKKKQAAPAGRTGGAEGADPVSRYTQEGAEDLEVLVRAVVTTFNE